MIGSVWASRLSALPAACAPAVLVCIFALPHAASGASAYTFTPSTYGMQLKTPDGRVVFEYMTKKPENAGLTAPSVACFHPVNTPSGERVTNLAPDDHPHHRGIWVGWQDAEFREPANLERYGPNHPLRALNITRADFWGWGVYAPRDGRVIQTRDIKLTAADSGHAQIEIHNDWMVANRKMLDESDTATVSERDGVYVLDLEYRLAPVVDYLLNRSAFGGFAVQCRKDGDSYYATAAGKVTAPDPHYSYPELNLPAEPWYDFTIKLNGSGKVVGAAVIDHPRNPPATWHNARYLWMLNPAITGSGPMTIHPDAPLTLRYRVVVHDGDTPTALLQKLSAEWREGR
jgi:Methane oxygenase PmoA